MKTALLLMIFSVAVLSPQSCAVAADEKKTADPAVLQPLIRDLKNEDSQIRRDAAVEILRLGPPAEKAIPALLEAMKDEDPIVRQNAVDAVAEIAEAAPGVIPALVQTLKDDDYLVRAKSAEALGNFGPAARQTVVPLLLAAKDEKKLVRAFVMEALGKIGPPEKVVPTLIEGLKDPEGIVRLRAASALELAKTPQARQALERYWKEIRHKR